MRLRRGCTLDVLRQSEACVPEQPNRHSNAQAPDRSDWTTAVAIAVAIAICLIAFIWIFLRLDPYLSDFVSDDPATPAIEASPTAYLNVLRDS